MNRGTLFQTPRSQTEGIISTHPAWTMKGVLMGKDMDKTWEELKLLNMGKLLEGKTAIITGASTGIGFATCAVFTEAGANLVMVSRREDVLARACEEINNHGGNAIYVASDISDHSSAKKVFDAAYEKFGEVDVVFNNAGFGDMMPLLESDDEYLQMVTDINYLGTLRYCREAVSRWLPENKKGVIVNCASTNGIWPVCGTVYTSTKAAIINMGRQIQMNYWDSNIRINTLCPGLTDTPMARSYSDGELPGGGILLKMSAPYCNYELPACDDVDQAYTALFLATDMSKGIRGRAIAVDNGQFL